MSASDERRNGRVLYDKEKKRTRLSRSPIRIDYYHRQGLREEGYQRGALEGVREYGRVRTSRKALDGMLG